MRKKQGIVRLIPWWTLRCYLRISLLKLVWICCCFFGEAGEGKRERPMPHFRCLFTKNQQFLISFLWKMLRHENPQCWPRHCHLCQYFWVNAYDPWPANFRIKTGEKRRIFLLFWSVLQEKYVGELKNWNHWLSIGIWPYLGVFTISWACFKAGSR